MASCTYKNHIKTYERGKLTLTQIVEKAKTKNNDMSQQEQLLKPHEDAIKCEDLFSIEGDQIGKVVAPRDAAMMQAAENEVMGHTLKGGDASALQSAIAKNEKARFAGHEDVSDGPGEQGVTITEIDMPGRRLITESIAGQIVGQYRAPTQSTTAAPTFQQGGGGGITIGEALEATALTAGRKPVEWSDAAAIQAAEVRATGRTTISPGGVAAAAQSAATLNARTKRDEYKTKLADILTDATSKLPADRPATRKDAEGVTGAEMRNDPFLTTHPAGVAASIAAAARLNQQNNFK